MLFSRKSLEKDGKYFGRKDLLKARSYKGFGSGYGSIFIRSEYTDYNPFKIDFYTEGKKLGVDFIRSDRVISLELNPDPGQFYPDLQS